MALRTLKGEKLEAERARLALMREYEDTYAACSAICGIDEAGRGPLAGPVVAGAAILPVDCEILFLNDSKSFPRSAGKRCLRKSRKRPLRGVSALWGRM